MSNHVHYLWFAFVCIDNRNSTSQLAVTLQNRDIIPCILVRHDSRSTKRLKNVQQKLFLILFLQFLLDE